MHLKPVQAITFSEIFGANNIPSIEYLIKNIPSAKALELLAYFMAQIHVNPLNQQTQLEILKKWLEPLAYDDKSAIISKLDRIKTGTISFFNNVSTCILYLYSSDF